VEAAIKKTLAILERHWKTLIGNDGTVLEMDEKDSVRLQ
jgi:hypothetical protein